VHYNAAVKKETREWLDIAEHDIRSAEGLLGLHLVPGAVYFCQQASEKVLKAMLVEQEGESPPRTHDLVELADLAGVQLTREQRTFLTRLSDQAVASRYPGPARRYTEEQIRELFEETKRFVEWLRSTLR
jgi:HEPN domain-containing protein